MGRFTQSLVGGAAAIGLVAVGFGAGSQTATAQPAEEEGRRGGSMQAMVETCERHMDEMRPMMENMMDADSMDNMMDSGRMGSTMDSGS